MSIEHEETNILPVTQELPYSPEVQAIHGHEEATALSGIWQAITEFRLGRAEKKLEKLESNDHVIKHTAIEVRTLRGFGTPPVQPDDKPISPVQRAALGHRARQVEKQRRNQRRIHRIEQIYGEPAPVESEPIVPRSAPGTNAANRWNKAAADLEKIDRGSVAAFDLTDRMSGKELRSRQTSQRKHTNSAQRISKVDGSLERGAAGDTRPGKLRARRIENQRQKIEKLRDKLS